MFNPRNIVDVSAREKVAVETSTKHTIVLKPGFKNRRNQSEYLKNSFPAGFLMKNKLVEKQSEFSLKDSHGGQYVNPYGSFTEWTKGEPVDTLDTVSLDLTDPYADVAGPYLSEMLLNRTVVQKPLPDGTNQFNTMIAKEIPLHNRSEMHIKPKGDKRRSPPKPPHIFNAPSSMPNFNPALGQNKVTNNLVSANPSEYDQWLATKHSDVGEKAWLVKGNAEGYNYSAYDFGGEKSNPHQLDHLSISTGYDEPSVYSPTHSQAIPPAQLQGSSSQLQQRALLQSQHYLTTASSSTLLTALPQPLPARILLEVHTLNQMVRTDKLTEDKHILRSVESAVTLAQLKCLVAEDIMRGIETAFRLREDEDEEGTPSSHHHHHQRRRHSRIDYTRVELNFQCFLPLVGTWRSVNNETDWILAKQNCRNDQNLIKLMYALEKNSEFLLLKDIQQSYQRRRDEAELRATPQISLRALTESMDQSVRLKKKYVYTDSAPPSTTASRSTTAFLPPPRPTNCLPVAHSIQPTMRSQGSSGRLSRGGSQSIHMLLDSLNQTDPFHEAHRQGQSQTHGDGQGQGHGQNSLVSSRQNSTGISAANLLGVNLLLSAPASASPTGSATSGGAVLNSSGSRSFFYPKRSDKLDKMYEDLESSMPRQQNFANNLEQRLFKTRW